MNVYLCCLGYPVVSSPFFVFLLVLCFLMIVFFLLNSLLAWLFIFDFNCDAKKNQGRRS